MIKPTDRKICKINDPRLDGYVNRTRSGSTQVFYTGNDSRDWDRYKDEGGGSKSGVDMHNKPDTIELDPPGVSQYAELFDGNWWWVEGCNQCNGRPRDGFTYIGECEKHDVCRTCETHRSKLKDTPWGGRDGWQCAPCATSQHAADKAQALAAMPEEYDSWDYHGVDEITCPYCALEFIDSSESASDDDATHECGRCDNTFKVTAVHSLSFNCDRIDKDSNAIEVA